MEKKYNKSLVNSINAMESRRWKEASEYFYGTQLNKVSRREITKSFFLLLPVKNSHAKGMLNAVLSTDKIRLFQKNEEGNTVLQEVMLYERYDVLEKIVASEKKFHYLNKKRNEIWYQVFETLLRLKRKKSVGKMLKKNILANIPDSESERIYLLIFSYKDESFFKYILKREKVLDISFLLEPETRAEQLFIQSLLERYTKKLIWEGGDIKRLFKIAVQCDAVQMIQAMLKQNPEEEFYIEMAGASDLVFRQLSKVRRKKIPDDIQRKVLLNAFATGGKERLEVLLESGWKCENADILNDYRKLVSRKKYSKYKRGQDEKRFDKENVRYLEEKVRRKM